MIRRICQVYGPERCHRSVVTMPLMRALLLQSPPDLPAAWLQELTDEFIEDPQCRLAVFGGDQSGAVLFSLWDPSVVEEVAEGLRTEIPSNATIRLLSMADSGFGSPPSGGALRE